MTTLQRPQICDRARKDELAVTRHVEALVFSFGDTVNNRHFYQTNALSPATTWDHCSPFFHAELEYSAKRSWNLEETLQLYREVGEARPTFTIKVLDVTTKVDWKNGQALCFTNIETSGEYGRSVFTRGPVA